MEGAFAEYADFLESYAAFLEEMSAQEQEQYHALASFSGERLTKALAGLQSGIMQLDHLEAKRMELQEKAGFGDATFQQILAQLGPEEAAPMRLLFRRIEMAVGNIKLMNGKALSFVQEGLAVVAPSSPLGEGKNLYAPPARGKPQKAVETPAAFEAQY